jgi:hypothetical protein
VTTTLTLVIELAATGQTPAARQWPSEDSENQSPVFEMAAGGSAPFTATSTSPTRYMGGVVREILNVQAKH